MASSYSVCVFCIRWSLLIYHFASFPITPFSPCRGFAHQGTELVPRHISLFGRDETSQTASAATLAPYRPPSSSLLSLPLTSNPCPTFFSHRPKFPTLFAASHFSLSPFFDQQYLSVASRLPQPIWLPCHKGGVVETGITKEEESNLTESPWLTWQSLFCQSYWWGSLELS